MSTTGSESAQKLLRVHEELASLQHHNDLRTVMSTAEGRRFVWDLLEHCGTFGPSYASEPLATSYNEGRRSIGIGLMTRCQLDATDFYITALNEQLALQKRASELRQAAEAEAKHQQENETE